MNTAPETHAATENVESKNGRDANRRFAPGNSGGPGNPYARKVAELRKALLGFVSIEELERIVTAIKKKAEQGDVAAARLILQYVLGKPTTPADPDLLAFDEWQKLQKLARPPREMSEVMHGVPAQVACDLTNIAWPFRLETNFFKPFQAGLKALDERDAKAAAAAAKKKARAAAAPKANGENGRSPTVAGVSDPGYSSAPKTNGGNGAAAPMANGENGATAPKANGENGAAAPIANGENGDRHYWGVAPMPNGDNGEEEDWLLRWARELLVEERSPNGKNGKAARRKRKR